MQFVKNNKGYTLLLTLVLIIIIISLFTTFAFATVSQQKQVEKTDKSFEANSIAEMGAEHYRYIILSKYNNAIRDLKICISIPEPDYNSCLQKAVETDIYKIKGDLTLIEGKEHHVLSDLTTNSVLYKFNYTNKDDYSNETKLIAQEQNEEGITKYIDYFHIKLDVTGINTKTNESKTIKLNISLPLNLLSLNNPGEGSSGGDNLIPPPPAKETFPEPGEQCQPESGYLKCTSKNSIDFNWPDPDNPDTLLNKDVLYLHGDLELDHSSKNPFDLNGSKLYINGDFDLQMKNNNSNPESTWLKNGIIYVYNDSEFKFLSTSNLTLSISGTTSIFQDVLVKNNSKIELGGNLSFNEANTTININNSTMNIKGNVESTKNKQGFTLDGSSILYLNGSSNSFDQLSILDKNSKVCIRSDADITTFSYDSRIPLQDLKVFYLSLPETQIKPGYKKLSVEDFAIQCSVGNNSYNPSPELNEDDITSDIEYGSTP